MKPSERLQQMRERFWRESVAREQALRDLLGLPPVDESEWRPPDGSGRRPGQR